MIREELVDSLQKLDALRYAEKEIATQKIFDE